MKRFLILALSAGLLAPITLVGCGEKSETQVEQTTPHGTTTETKTVEQSGEAPPAPTGVTEEPTPTPAPAP